MLPHVKNWFALIFGSAVPLLGLGVLFSALYFNDVRDDRRRVVIVNALTPVFICSAAERGCDGIPLTTLNPGTKLSVRRIHYLKECATLDVALPDGRKAYIVLGKGDVSVNPPIPTS